MVSLYIAKCNDAWVDWQPTEVRAQVMVDSILRGVVKESKLMPPGAA